MYLCCVSVWKWTVHIRRRINRQWLARTGSTSRQNLGQWALSPTVMSQETAGTAICHYCTNHFLQHSEQSGYQYKLYLKICHVVDKLGTVFYISIYIPDFCVSGLLKLGVRPTTLPSSVFCQLGLNWWYIRTLTARGPWRNGRGTLNRSQNEHCVLCELVDDTVWRLHKF